MSVMGINFTKILATKTKGARGKISIKNNISITSVEAVKLVLGNDDQKTLKFTFNYITKYEPSIGSIELEGEVVYLTKSENAEKILSDYEKTKQVAGEIRLEILNSIIDKCTVQALILSKDMNLPAPIPLPKMTGKSVQKKAVEKEVEKLEKAAKKKTAKKE